VLCFLDRKIFQESDKKGMEVFITSTRDNLFLYNICSLYLHAHIAQKLKGKKYKLFEMQYNQ